MMLDSEMGCPVNLNLYEGVWGTDKFQKEAFSKLNPENAIPPAGMHKSDLELLQPATTSSHHAQVNGHPGYTGPTAPHTTHMLTAETLGSGPAMPVGGYQGAMGKKMKKPEVSWLRNTTYLSREASKRNIGNMAVLPK